MRLRKPAPQVPEASRELNAIDAFLADDPASGIDAELAQILAAVQSDRPVPRYAFVRALDARIFGRFREPRGEKLDPAASGLRRFLRPVPLAAGTGAALF